MPTKEPPPKKDDGQSKSAQPGATNNEKDSRNDSNLLGFSVLAAVAIVMVIGAIYIF